MVRIWLIVSRSSCWCIFPSQSAACDLNLLSDSQSCKYPDCGYNFETFGLASVSIISHIFTIESRLSKGRECRSSEHVGRRTEQHLEEQWSLWQNVQVTLLSLGRRLCWVFARWWTCLITFPWDKPASPCSDPFYTKMDYLQLFFLTSHHHPKRWGRGGRSHETEELSKTAEMLRNLTLDDTSANISYSAGWSVQFPGDPQLSSFLGSTYHATQTNGSTANITFNGMYFGSRIAPSIAQLTYLLPRYLHICVWIHWTRACMYLMHNRMRSNTLTLSHSPITGFNSIVWSTFMKHSHHRPYFSNLYSLIPSPIQAFISYRFKPCIASKVIRPNGLIWIISWLLLTMVLRRTYHAIFDS